MSTKQELSGVKVFKTSARRKFNLIGDLVSNLHRGLGALSHQTSTDWLYVPRKDLIKRMTMDYNDRMLPVGGMAVPKIDCSVVDVIQHIQILPPPFVKEEPSGKKLKFIPVFYLKMNEEHRFVTYGSYQPTTRNCGEMVASYYKSEQFHKRQEDHHPEFWKDVGTKRQTMECVFDIFNCLLRKYTLLSAYEKLLHILIEKASKLCPDGVYAALLHILCRGVASTEILRKSSEWRASRTQAELYFLHKSYCAGKSDPVLEKQYKEELFVHAATVTGELSRLRLGGRTHDYTKFAPTSVYFYSWFWGVFQQMSKTNQYRARVGMELPAEVFMEGRETMYSMGTSFGNGVANSCLPERVSESVKAATEEAIPRIQEALAEERQALRSEAEELINDFTTKVDEVTDTKLGKLEELIGKISTQFDSVLSTFDAIKTTIASMFDKMVTGVTSMPGFQQMDLSFDRIVAALRDYILYVNVECKFLKTLLALSLLKNLGIFKLGAKWIMEICAYYSEATGEETSSLPDLLGSSVSKIANIVCAGFASIVQGSVLTVDQFWSLVKQLAGPMKYLHQIGGGCLGLTRIFDFIKKIYETTSEWIAVHIFRQVPEMKQLSNRICIWVAKVKYFNTEAGLNAIRLNESIREKAKQLFAEYLELSVQARQKTEYRHLLLDIERQKREVQNVYDYIVRLEAMSTFCPTMFHLQFYGEPGCGKSHMTKPFVRDVSRALWPDDKKDSLYSYNPNLEFFDGYAGQRVFLMDDAFRMQEPKHLTTLIGLITNTPVILPMANLSDKGTQLTSDVMVSSTNTPWPVGKDVLCMEAVLRRRHMLVEVKIDPRVRDSSTGQFSKALYLQHYKEEDLPSYPHLRFNLSRPVPKSATQEDSIQMCSAANFAELQKYAQKLKDANAQIETAAGGSLDPMFYFSEENKPPEPFQLPCMDWTYHELIHNFVVRYRAFRGLEDSYNPQKRYTSVEYAISELEMLFCQSDDLPNEPALPVNTITGEKIPLISKWFTDVHHPFGVSDEIGQAIAENGPTLAPELDEISANFDELVEDILRDPQETVLTASEEIERINRLVSRNARLRQREPPALREKLSVVHLGGQQYVPLNAHATQWEGIAAQRSLYWEKQKHFDVAVMSHFQHLFSSPDATTEQTIWKHIADHFKADSFWNNIYKFLWSANAYYPDKPEFGELAGKQTKLPLYFLQNLAWVAPGRWALNVSSLLREPLESGTISVCHSGVEYEVPADIAFILSTSTIFRIFCIEFDNLTFDQQRLLVEDAVWRNQFTGMYTLASVKKDMTNIIAKMSISALECVMSPITYLARKYPSVLHKMGYLAVFGVSVWILRSMAKLIIGSSNETSKYLHRGPESAIRYHGRVTATEESDKTMSNLLLRNVRQLKITTAHGSAIVQGFMNGRYLFFPKHVFRYVTDKEFELEMQTPGTGDAVQYIIPMKDVVIEANSDICAVTQRTFPQYTNIDKKFITDKQFEEMVPEGELHLLSRFNGLAQVECFGPIRKSLKPTMRLSDGSEAELDRALIVSGSTVSGRSGSMAVRMTPQHQSQILGFQVWAVGLRWSPEVAIQVITQEMMDKLKGECDKRVLNCVTRVADFEVDPPEELSGVFTSVETNQVVAQVEERVGIVGKTQFSATPIASLMDRDGFGSTRVPAALNQFDSRLKSKIHPLHHSVNKYVRGTVKAMKPVILDKVVDSLSTYIAGRLDKMSFRVLSLEETVTGTREDGSNPMNLATSPGVPFIHTKKLKGKKDYFNINENGEVDFMNPETVQQYGKFLSYLRRRKLPLTWAYDFPKDELRPEAKVVGSSDVPPKTRTVTCMNMFYILAWRQYTLDFWAAMHRAADGTFPSCPGINPEGPDWSNAFHYLNEHPNVVDFDVSNWDGFLTPEMLSAVGRIIKSVIGADDETSAIIDCVFFEVANSYIQYDNYIYHKIRGMVSGFPGTAEVNTLVHWLLVVYYYMKIAPMGYDNYEAFRRHVSLLVYGDDVVISFSDEIGGWFNGVTLAEQYKAMGYPVTSASKTGVIEARKALSEVSFLKSSWRHLGHDIYVRKMDLSVAFDLLYWVRAKEHPDEQFLTNAIDSLRIVFGHGPEVYDKFLKRLNRWLQQTGFAPITYTYRDLEVDHLNRYYLM